MQELDGSNTVIARYRGFKPIWISATERLGSDV